MTQPKKVRKTPQRTVCVSNKTWDAAKATAKARGDNLSEVIRRSFQTETPRNCSGTAATSGRCQR